jgi:hypothetical protein
MQSDACNVCFQEVAKLVSTADMGTQSRRYRLNQRCRRLEDGNSR